MRYTEIISEAYDMKRCNNLRGYAKDICNWCFNERHPGWDESEIENVKNQYGRVSVGTVYRGAKIDTEEDYTKYKGMVSGGSVKVRLVSATPHESEAKSFALYVKSYDEMTMMYALSAAIRNGAAGKFGGVLITLEPTPDNVVFKTYVNGNEKSENPNWKRCKGAESEVMLDGIVKVKSVKIFEKLTTENWIQTVYEMISTKEDLNNEFTSSWIRENKLYQTPEYADLKQKLITKIVKSEDDIFSMLRGHGLITEEDMSKNPLVQNFVKKYFQYKNPLGIYYKDQHSRINMDLYPMLAKKNSVMSHLKSILEALPVPQRAKYGILMIDGKDFEEIYGQQLHDIYTIISRHPDVVSKLTKYPFIKFVSNECETIKNQILSFNCLNFEGQRMHGNPIFKGIDFLTRYGILCPKIKDIKQVIFNHIYHDFIPEESRSAPGDVMQKRMEVYSELVKYCYGKFNSVNLVFF